LSYWWEDRVQGTF